MERGQRRQPVVHPADQRRGMPPRGLLPQRRGGLDRHHLPAPRREPGGVAAAAGADIQHQAGLRRQEGQGAGMDLGEAEGLIGLGEFAEAAMVGGDGVPTPGRRLRAIFAHAGEG